MHAMIELKTPRSQRAQRAVRCLLALAFLSFLSFISLLACGGSRPSRPASPSAESATENPPTERSRGEIERLWRQIEAWRAAPRSSDPVALSSELPRATELSCQDQLVTVPDPGPCTDTCTLRQAICDNAAEICRIAGELAPDPWSEEKCAAAETSCDDATRQCCDCLEQA